MLYEATLIISPHVSHEELPSLWEKMNKEIESLGATIKKEVKPFERTLAYPIKRGGVFRRAYLGTLYLEPQKEPGLFAKALASMLKGQQMVVRSMVTHVKAVPELSHKSAVTKFSSKKGEQSLISKEVEGKEDKPPLAELDKKLEEILDDKIGF